MSDSKPLNAMEKVFVDEYLVLLKPEEAARRAGYSESTCKSKAYTWVKDGKCPANKRHVFDAIQKAKKARAERTQIDADWLLKRLAMIADFNINRFLTVNKLGQAYYDFSTATDDDWYCISELTSDQILKGKGDDIYEVERVKLKIMDRMKALEMIGRHIDVSAFRENLDVNVNDRRDALAKARKRLERDE